MIELPKGITPSKTALDELKSFQSSINTLGTFSERSAKAKELFPQKNTKSNATFNEIKKKLAEMCNSTRRCVYCEDSLADEVEHIYPKDLFPEKCFDWENYIYACGPCNGPKNNKFAIFKQEDGSFAIVNPPKGQPATQPPAGDAALINPRMEDPLQFAILDLSNTFKFFPLPTLSAKDKKKMEYSYDEVLKLNHEEREPLRQARENAYGMYKARIAEYVQKKQQNVSLHLLEKLKEGILKENHPTVWKEMQRHYRMELLVKVDEELKQYFDNAPEALTW
jgi:5-methylcytosine-specific restriction endonuclease McrA